MSVLPIELVIESGPSLRLLQGSVLALAKRGIRLKHKKTARAVAAAVHRSE